jgi:hypothetical protein
MRARIFRASSTGKRGFVRPVATELAAKQEGIRELVLEGQGDFVQYLVDPAE